MLRVRRGSSRTVRVYSAERRSGAHRVKIGTGCLIGGRQARDIVHPRWGGIAPCFDVPLLSNKGQVMPRAALLSLRVTRAYRRPFWHLVSFGRLARRRRPLFSPSFASASVSNGARASASIESSEWACSLLRGNSRGPRARTGIEDEAIAPRAIADRIRDRRHRLDRRMHRQLRVAIGTMRADHMCCQSMNA